jgi:negative regulator of sigma-B (phosphoserine phosphatase)
VLLAVIDGVGHGPEARDAADLAAREIRRRPTEPLGELVEQLHATLKGSRGAAVTLARWRAVDAVVELLGVGNVAAWVIGPAGEQRYRPTPGVLGARWPPHRPNKHLELGQGRMLVLATDGISSRATVERRVVTKGPIAVAQHLLDEHGKDHDDALVAVLG